MIWIWLRTIASLFFWLIVPPKSVFTHRVIDPNETCPICGNSSGTIQCIPRDTENGNVLLGVTVRHTCQVCNAHWHTEPVTKEHGGYVYP